jgi:hypothetical protein
MEQQASTADKASVVNGILMAATRPIGFTEFPRDRRECQLNALSYISGTDY